MTEPEIADLREQFAVEPARLDAAVALLAEARAVLDEARFHVTVEREARGIHQCSRCDLDARIDILLAKLDAAAPREEER